jgi:NitT/TauT family transport system substrate-binding protein
MQPLTAYLYETLCGNTNAFNEVILRFQEQALRKAYGKLGDYLLAEEAVQEAFLNAYENLASLRQLNRFPGWFQSILVSCISRTIRKNSFNLSYLKPNDFAHPELLPQIDSGDFQQRELLELVNRAIDTLPPKTQAVCSYFYYYGYSLKEISGLLGIPIGTVKRKLHEARGQIREYLILERLIQGIRVGYMPISDHLLAMVSHQINGYDDFIIDLRKFLSWSSLVNAIRNGLIDVAFIMAPLALALKNEGVPIRYILDAAHGGSAITVRNSIRSTNALSGARLGLPLARSTHHLLLHYFLANESISVRKDISETYLSPSYSIGALKNHRIDGFFCAEPWNTKAVHEGIGHILVRSNQIAPGHICCIIVVNNDFVKQQGEILNRYVKLLLDARKLICHSSEKCAQIQSRYTGIHPNIARAVLRESHISFSNLIPNREKIENTMNMAVSAGTIEEKCDLDAFICREFI